MVLLILAQQEDFYMLAWHLNTFPLRSKGIHSNSTLQICHNFLNYSFSLQAHRESLLLFQSLDLPCLPHRLAQELQQP